MKDSWIQTVSGGRVFPLEARGDIEIGDIAHALSNICRFTGHTSQFYSVAQHSVLVSQWCEPAHALLGLLHDAAEAYLGDMSSPTKHGGSMLGREFVGYEQRLLAAILGLLIAPGELRLPLPDDVVAADRWLLAAEARDLMNDPDWAADVRHSVSPPLERVPTIEPWQPTQARYEFLVRFYRLALLRKNDDNT
jgi:hypothetical protein